MAVETTRATQAPGKPAVTTKRFDPRKGWHEDPPTPPEAEFRRRARRLKLVVLMLFLILGAIVFWMFVPEKPVDYTDIHDHFKYGSIGSEAGKGMPYRIWKVLPAMFPQYLPDAKTGYASLGFVYETDPATGQRRDRPIGFSMRRMQGIDFVGLNCSVCHTGTYRGARGDKPTIELGMPAHQLDLLAYFKFLFDCVGDGRFTVENVLAAIDADQKLGPIDRLIYTIAIPRVRQETLRLKALAQFMVDHPSGRGRIDTFTPYKTMNFGYRDTSDFSVGNADFPSIWNQRIREGMPLHWDGNNPSLFERNISAAMGAGATPVSLDVPRMNRVADWLLDLKPPVYPSGWKRDAAMAGRGEALYRQHCADCHGLKEEKFQGRQVGALQPIARIRTDPERLDSYTLDLSYNQYTLGADRFWRFHNFRKTDGYANQPIDGIWARTPYLHNGSVPTLRDLLNPPCSARELEQVGYPPRPADWDRRSAQVRERWAVQASGGLRDDAVKAIVAKSRAMGRRPPVFFRGYDVYDQDRAGFVANVGSDGGRSFTRFDVNVRGNGNGGHEYGLDLPPADKDALVEYLKGL